MSPLPSTIKAITIPRHGGVDVLEETEIPFPAVGPGDVVIKVEWAGVNFVDTYQRQGVYPVPSFPFTLGVESAGTIVALPTDEAILNSESFKKHGLKLGGKAAVLSAGGSFAEYVSVSWINVLAVPDSVSTRTAAAIVVQGLTALTAMTESYDVKKGDTVLVHTVAGGLGLFFAQIAKARGATVIGTTSTAEKAAIAKEYGADQVILYKSENTVKRVIELTGGKGVDVIYDGVGKDTFESDFEMVKRKGTIVTIGNASGQVPDFPPRKLAEKNVKLVRPRLYAYLVEPEEVQFYKQGMLGLLEKGLKVLVYKEYPFSADGVKQSQLDLTGGKTVGKLLIKVRA